MIKHPPWIALATITYSALLSDNLVATWMASPLERFGFLPFLIWLAPALWYWTTTLSENQTRCIGCAIAVTFLGQIASVNTIKHLGLAISVASLMPVSASLLAWILLAISWIPALGWVVIHYLPEVTSHGLLAARVSLAILSVFIIVKDRYGKS